MGLEPSGSEQSQDTTGEYYLYFMLDHGKVTPAVFFFNIERKEVMENILQRIILLKFLYWPSFLGKQGFWISNFEGQMIVSMSGD